MFSLFGEVNLWTFDDNIVVKDVDFGAFRCHDKRVDNIYEEGKRSYCQKRGMIYVPTNKKGNKLKDSIKYLEEQLKDNSIIYCQWYDDCILQLMLSNALLIHIQINNATGDISKIVFDKYLIGKLPEHISDVTITRNHVLCTYNDNQVALVHFTKSKRHIFDKISKLEPKLLIIDLFGQNGRRVDKKIQMNKSGDMALIWWKSTMNEVYPWSPVVKEHDRANIHLYRLLGTKLELLCYIRSEFDPLCIMFNTHHDNIIHSVEQKVSRKGEVTIEWRTYEVSQQDKLQRIAMISVPLPTHTSCTRFSPNQELLLLCCIDGSVIIYDQTRATTVSVKAAFIPTLASWHSDGIIFVIGNDRGQFQYFDISLSCIKSQTLSEEATPSNILDLSSYFRIQPALLRLDWNKKTDQSCYIDFYTHANAFLLLLFQRGPMGVIRLIEGDILSGDILVKRYLSLSQTEQATSLLLAMNWDTYPRACMHSLNQILNYLFKLPLTTERENLIQNALGSFHVPIKPISQSVEEEYGDEIRDLTRRFFYHLLRYQMFEKAFRLAIDLNDHDLFMDLHFYALVVNDMAMANSAREKAEQILSRSNSCSSSHSTCSRTSCSLCSDSASDKRDESYSEDSENETKDSTRAQDSKEYDYRKEPSSQIPPLPVLHPHHNTKNLFSSSFNEISSNNKSDCNLVSTSFIMPTVALHTPSFNQSLQFSAPTTYFPLTQSDKTVYKSTTSTGSSTLDNSHPLQVLDNVSDDLMSTSFGSLSMNDSKATSTAGSNENSVGDTMSISMINENDYTSESTSNDRAKATQVQNCRISTAYNNPAYSSVKADDSSNLLTSSSANVNGNIMSTSFSANVSEISTPYYNSAHKTNARSKSENPYTFSKSINSYTIGNDVVPKTLSNSMTTDKLTSTFYNTSSNLMSTSFNFLDDQVVVAQNNGSKALNANDRGKVHHLLNRKSVDFNVPLPPSLTHSFAHGLQNLPQKNYPLSQSTPGLLNLEEPSQKIVVTKAPHVSMYPLQKQSSTPNILQSHLRHQNVKPRTYRLNYNLDYISLHGSCDNINVQSNSNSIKLSAPHSHGTYSSQNPFESRQLRLAPAQNNSTNVGITKESRVLSNIPPLPIITNCSTNTKTTPALVEMPLTTPERPKVKFSDTVTHILVPGMGQSHKQKRSTVTQVHITDPKRELAESLPLCLGNEDYLKNFQPLSRDDENEKVKEPTKSEESTKIKVVHFGLL